jgi:glycosyltransferase involved in cell wall biosynthesis
VVPKVSVIIPVRNGANTIARAIDSALAQTYTGGTEIIVVNNGSTDATADVIRRYGDRIVAVDEPRPGVSAARNTAVNAARGEYIAFLDADDEWLPEKLARTVSVLDEDPECVLAYHDAFGVDATGTVCCDTYNPPSNPLGPSLGHLLAGADILTSCAVMRRETYQRCGGCREELICAQDLFLWLTARELGPFRFVAGSLTRYRFVLTPQREENYLKGTIIYERLVREGFGVKVSNVKGLLETFGLVHIARGDRALARQRYLAALRRGPFDLRIYARLLWTFVPSSIARALRSMMTRRIARALNGPPGGYWQCIAL